MSTAPRINVRVTRRYNAPPGRVFDAWLNPEMIGKWMFGPALRDEEVVRFHSTRELEARFRLSCAARARRSTT
jgi:uncharacterized protein YndB with AHSA1/START domain